jgi:hypothetical protein
MLRETEVTQNAQVENLYNCMFSTRKSNLSVLESEVHTALLLGGFPGGSISPTRLAIEQRDRHGSSSTTLFAFLFLFMILTMIALITTSPPTRQLLLFVRQR